MTTEQTTAYKVDKSKWGDGPWQTEPDRKEWRHPSGLPCLMVRQEHHGSWCGYVGVPPGHPLHGKGCDAVDLEVHGGPTYANACRGPICHVPAAGESDEVWWFGFDCAHAFDLSPGYQHRLPAHLRGGCDETYRDETYVTAEVNRLAEQLAALAGRATNG